MIVESTLLPLRCSGRYSVSHAAITAASSSRRKPLDWATVTLDGLPLARTAMLSITVPCSPRRCEIRGYWGMIDWSGTASVVTPLFSITVASCSTEAGTGYGEGVGATVSGMDSAIGSPGSAGSGGKDGSGVSSMIAGTGSACSRVGGTDSGSVVVSGWAMEGISVRWTTVRPLSRRGCAGVLNPPQLYRAAACAATDRPMPISNGMFAMELPCRTRRISP